jgi:hypothetical protein
VCIIHEQSWYVVGAKDDAHILCLYNHVAITDFIFRRQHANRQSRDRNKNTEALRALESDRTEQDLESLAMTAGQA